MNITPDISFYETAKYLDVLCSTVTEPKTYFKGSVCFMELLNTDTVVFALTCLVLFEAFQTCGGTILANK